MKCLLMSSGVLLAFAAMADYPRVVESGVSLEQNSYREVRIRYTLTDGPAIVTTDILTNGVSIGAQNFTSLTGAVNRLVTEVGTEQLIFWQPCDDWPGRRLRGTEVTAVVTAWSTNRPPAYMVIDLTKTTPEESVLARRYYSCAEALPGGVGDVAYKTDKLVMRRIPAANVQWRMGHGGATQDEASGNAYASPNSNYSRLVTLTKDYYMAVYELTKHQFRRIMRKDPPTDGYGAWPVRRDAINSHWGDMRGDYVGSDYEWPQKGRAVRPDHGLGLLRAATGIEFDLPTEAQWEFACRAGTLTPLYSGKNIAAKWSADANCNEIGWVATGAFHEVGLKPCNAWGLYDMIGNAAEICLDKASDSLGTEPVVDPVGALTSNHTKQQWGITLYRHVVRGGSANDNACNFWSKYAAADVRNVEYDTLNSGDYIGVRLVCPGAMVW